MQGVGRYPPSEVAQRGKDDLRALSKYLGKKEFLMGNKPSKVRMSDKQKGVLLIPCHQLC